jgi:hypothetical protein
MDEAQELELLAGQHCSCPPDTANPMDACFLITCFLQACLTDTRLMDIRLMGTCLMEAICMRLYDSPETNHERTLSVPYVFRKPLISREQVESPLQATLKDRV